jgi:hypothetical protein
MERFARQHMFVGKISGIAVEMVEHEDNRSLMVAGPVEKVLIRTS